MQEPDIVDAEYEEIDKPTVNVGTVGHCDHGKSAFKDAYADFSDGEYEPVIPFDLSDDHVDTPKMTKGEMLEALKTAATDGHITAKEAKRMKRDLGIYASDFTKKKETNQKRKLKRAAQKKARRKQRK